MSWEGLAASNKNPVTIITDISPRGIETTVGGGTLSILVFDANGNPISQADVSIIATSTNPQVNLNLLTGDNGRIILPGSPVCTACYQITVSKENYSSDRTYSIVEIANPDKPHQSVIEGFLTEVSFAIDKVGNLNIASVTDREHNFTSLADIDFTLRGDKTLGTDVEDNLVYKFQNNFTTDSSGQITIENLEWDNYQISVDPDGDWNISGFNPLLPITVLPDSTTDSVFALSNLSEHSLLVSFTDSVNNPIASVSARLFDNGGYEATASSGLTDDPDFGQSFFSDLTSQIYHFQATASGYLDFDGNISVGGYTSEKVILTPD